MMGGGTVDVQSKLILRSARRSVQDYLIYLVTLTLCVGLFYAFLSISSRYYHPALGAEFDLSFLSGVDEAGHLWGHTAPALSHPVSFGI